MSKEHPHPPSLAIWLLKQVYGSHLFNEVSGDLEELFNERVRTRGKLAAKAHYWKDAFLSIRNFDLAKRTSTSRNYSGLLLNYVKTAIRSLKANPTSATISIGGLAMAIGCALTAFLFADLMLNLDGFHHKKDRIFQVIRQVDEEGNRQTYGSTPLLLGPALSNDHSAIESTARMQYSQANVRFGTKVFKERILFTDPTFLQMFDFPMNYGDKNALASKSSIVISKELSEKFFGEVHPMGRSVSIKFSDKLSRTFVVAGVLGERPENSSFRLNLLLPFDNYLDVTEIVNPTWSDEVRATFIMTQEADQAGTLHHQLNTYKEPINGVPGSVPTLSLELYALPILADHSHEIVDRVSFGNLPEGNYSFMAVGILLLLMASFNYMNVAVASATKRLKEIGIRKVLGSAKMGIMYQFLTENLLICFFSLAAGTLLCYFFFLPGFNIIAPVEVPFRFSSIPLTVSLYLGILIFLGVVSGAYPAFYISRLDAVHIFKGTTRLRSKNYFTRVLLTVQLFLAFMTIAGSIIFSDNVNHLKQLSWGYDPKDVLAIRANSPEELKTLSDEAMKLSPVISMGMSNGHIGPDNNLIDIDHLDKQFKCLSYEVSPGYLETMGIPLQSGAAFEPNNNEINQHAIVINRQFADKMGWDDPVGKFVDLGGASRQVIGVVGDIRHAFFSREPILPMVFTSRNDDQYHYLVIKGQSDNLDLIDQTMQTTWSSIAPDDPFDRTYQSEIFNNFYTNIDENRHLIISISAMSIILACLGLYGLVGLKMQLRFKEFGIRKVLGAHPATLMKLANKEYLWTVGIAFLLGAPAGISYISSLVERIYSISKPLTAVPVLTALIISLVSIGLTVLFHIKKASEVNPVEILRDE